jgi:TrmH family RNA methyltransferase
VKLLSVARDLKRRKARERLGLFVAEGVRTVEALAASPLRVRGTLHTKQATDDFRTNQLLTLLASRDVPSEEVSEQDFASAADTESPQGILALAEIPHRPLHGFPTTGTALLLDAVQDPGNVGTILRSAAALGVSVTISLPGTVDVWNAKVVRSSMGALFTHHVAAMDWTAAQQWLDGVDMPLWVAAADGEDLARVATTRPARLALVVANEGAGVSPQVAAAAAKRVAIPMVHGTESLNVAVATGILLYVLGASAS